MLFHDDMSYVNQDLIDRKLMKSVPYSVRLDRYFTEEEKEANKKFAEENDATRNSTEWLKHCEESRCYIAKENYSLMEFLEKHFSFGQFREDYPSKYNFWFWCNTLFNVNGNNERDYSYITLTLEKENIQENEMIFQKMKKLLENYEAKNIQAIFRYGQIPVEENINTEAERIFNLCDGKFVNFGSYTGKISKQNGEYTFKKKGAKKYFYIVSALDICKNIIC